MVKALNGRLHVVDQRSKAAYYLHALRWFSAFYVMIYHLRPVLFKGYEQLEQKSLLVKGLYAATSIGNEFVMLFFVLSGYLIAGSVLRSVAAGTWSWKTYLLNRVTRLWVVLFASLLLTYVWARAQLFLFPQYDRFSDSLGWLDFVGNLLFLQGLVVPNYGENIPLWSLCYEFWYYMIFPCLILAFVANRIWKRVVYGAAFLVMAVLLGKAIMLYFLIWLLGAALVLVPAPRISERLLTRVAVPAAGCVSAVLLVAGKAVAGANEHAAGLAGFLAVWFISVGFAALIYAILHGYKRQASVQEVKRLHVHVVLAGFSYTLYLTHYPIVNFVRVWLGDGKWGSWNPDLPHLLLAVVIAIAICVYAWLLSLITEAKTAEFRNFAKKLLDAPFRGKKSAFDAKGHHIQGS
ncbi:Peptidoglycan/LPS O-acetylase OafA/YrhL, contains acyltransferase and SGNH-hydrolase domains [Paenibacillus sp. UNCCL117]|uniref:acyltransferase family protein n=1 Tax=unclassified Paenibacillus TaxID=185978 RepID=UPI0008834B6C|nr:MULTISPECIES: acyltransferase [unclassified Paenibacillus]SDC03034.1 Peptidoglycan/LPS O-acetylase OafA/YrhL, contains acyltransferase and SGNH-hydrolase domains [Paenibacillus sp. cl123]SFW36984.1 Peptidoglycan/LPS O-acetylase OafA/YrhL, contains acyltransferase and SGNH-hydrolase domains [Paenibacillus sp. UNCCL117]